jgi:dihydrofolate reductase
MRKLKLQMQMTVDGYVAGPNGELDWMIMNDEPPPLINDLVDSSGTLLLGRKMTDEFMNHWENVVDNQPDSRWFSFAKKMVDIPKIVFSRTLNQSVWTNTSLANKNLADEIADLKNRDGKDILVYGGADFVSSLIAGGHIDEFNFFINPVMIGAGMRIFERLDKRQNLLLIDSTAYESGKMFLRYRLGDE